MCKKPGGVFNIGELRKQSQVKAITNSLRESTMEKYICTICGYVYDPENGDPDSGIEPGTAFEDIPEDWVCPVCGASKQDFEIAE